MREHFQASWEWGFRLQLTLLGAIAISLAAVAALKDRLPWLTDRLESHSFREWTGFAALAALAFELLVSARKRTRLPLPGSFPAWRAVHKLSGLAMLWMVAVHTGGAWGTALNGLMTAVFVGLLFLAQAGHVMKAWAYQRAHHATRPPPPMLVRLNEAANTDEGWVHRSGLHVHVLLATLLAVLAAFHVLAVYLF